MKNLNHSKVKNTGILFEFLVRQITVDTLEGRDNSPAIALMKKYFHPVTELGKELQLYRVFFDMGKLNETKAVQFIDLISDQKKKLDNKKLSVEKYNLIKEVKQQYDLNSFLQVKIPSYKIYASIYKTFLAESKDFNISNIKDLASARFALIEHLSTDKKISSDPANETAILEIFKNQTEDLRLLSYKLMMDKFNQKYENLNDKQKILLREYINSISNSERFTNYVKSEITPLKNSIRSLAGSQNDQVLKIKLNEVVSQLDTISTKKKIRDNELTALMIAYQLIDELSC